MSEIKRKVEAYHIDMRCDKCNMGYMRVTGKIMTVNPTLYEHECTYCGCTAWYNRTYPTTENKMVEVDE